MQWVHGVETLVLPAQEFKGLRGGFKRSFCAAFKFPITIHDDGMDRYLHVTVTWNFLKKYQLMNLHPGY